MGRGGLGGVAVGLGCLLLGPVAARAAPVVVSTVLAGSTEGRLQLEIRGSEPINYAVVEGAEPFSVSLLLLNAVFGFPTEERELPGPGLTRIKTTEVEREGSRIGRLDLTFDKSVPYGVLKVGSRIFVRADAPPPPSGLVLGAPPAEPGGRARPAPVSAPAGIPTTPPAGAMALIRELRAEIAGEERRVLIGADRPLAYKSFTMDKPYRVVVDFERAKVARAEDTIEVADAVLKRIRSSQFSPSSVRVVLDLARPTPYRIEAHGEGLVILLGAGPRP